LPSCFRSINQFLLLKMDKIMLWNLDGTSGPGPGPSHTVHRTFNDEMRCVIPPPPFSCSLSSGRLSSGCLSCRRLSFCRLSSCCLSYCRLSLYARIPVACLPVDCLPVACLPVACLPVACLEVRARGSNMLGWDCNSIWPLVLICNLQYCTITYVHTCRYKSS
jgi:hypothetical protein